MTYDAYGQKILSWKEKLFAVLLTLGCYAVRGGPCGPLGKYSGDAGYLTNWGTV